MMVFLKSLFRRREPIPPPDEVERRLFESELKLNEAVRLLDHIAAQFVSGVRLPHGDFDYGWEEWAEVFEKIFDGVFPDEDEQTDSKGGLLS